jgi:hypothetical protein
MPRTLTESRTFTTAEVDAALTAYARLEIIGQYYEGRFSAQRVKRHADGSVTVETTHTPADRRRAA